MHMLCFLGFVTKHLYSYHSVKGQLPMHSVKKILKIMALCLPSKNPLITKFWKWIVRCKSFPNNLLYMNFTRPVIKFMRSFCIIKIITVQSLNQGCLEQLWFKSDMPKAIVTSICFYQITDVFVTISLFELKHMLCPLKILCNHQYFNTIIKLWTTLQQYWNIFSINIINKWQIHKSFQQESITTYHNHFHGIKHPYWDQVNIFTQYWKKSLSFVISFLGITSTGQLYFSIVPCQANVSSWVRLQYDS